MKKLRFLPLLVLALSTIFIFTQCKDEKEAPIDKPIVDDGGVKLEDLTPVVEIASFDTTFAKENTYISCTINWGDLKNWADEAALVKISIAEQLDMLNKAKKGNGGKDVALYISQVDVWVATTAFYSAIAYEGNQTNFTQVAKGEDIAQEVVGDKFPRIKLQFNSPCKITGLKDLFVGALASNTAVDSRPFTICYKNPKFQGLTAKFPSFGVCPDVEKYLQEVNDPNETDRWGWSDNTNWCIKVTISKEIVY